ncbi:tRNA uridine(34) 5-carboxymethylaminomethyl modification radical SAM/GNAT enzyme Elp3 [Patescibacteria group bacterium]|nr:tRNA uridine(34) 5-carboxymethylaminomethyl modification radical SAM/GNAT enzyme Elp3 [Patescibacteria group bacterium]
MTIKEQEKLVIELYNQNINNISDFVDMKKNIFGRYKLNPPQNSDVLKIYNDLVFRNIIKKNYNFEFLCKKHRVRTLSGVAVIAILTKPYKCPGNCAFCPTQEDMPKSYLSNEPAVMRAIKNNFDPKKQIEFRLNSLKNTGHDTSKIEIIIMGGTWSYFDYEYKEYFIKSVFDALNGFDSKNLEEAQINNETSKNRCVGLTLETRPDYINEKELIEMRKFGTTRVEIGVESIYDDVFDLNKRGHHVKEVVEATKLLKDAGFKICYHLMPGLPGSSLKRDFEMFEKIYTDQNFCPDMVKIYPCVVTKNAEIYNWVKNGSYIPYSDSELMELLIEIKKITPYWVRINRLIRDIPSTSIEYGNKIPNLREIIKREMNKNGDSCNCIRCREIKGENIDKNNIKLFIDKYEASSGIEYFLSYENKERTVLYSFLRLRIPSYYFSKKDNFIPELKNCSIIREIHTYGLVTNLLEKENKNTQHIGFGKKLIKEAEKITLEYNIKKIAVISGVGVKEYYKKIGFIKSGTYMIKAL